MLRFRSILAGLLFVTLSEVWTKDNGDFDLGFVTWPNETQAVVNDTVKFMWKYYVQGTDVNIKWGPAKFITTSVATFTQIFFTATNYEKTRKVEMNEKIPSKYRKRVQIVSQATLQIVNVTLEDEGVYLCEITDASEWKTLSRAVTLRVLIPPTIESHPRETILLSEGERLKIGCKASGRPVPVVIWLKDGIELTQDTGSSEYNKEKIARNDAGNYICNARNNASQDQFIVQVIVQYKPVATKIKTDAKSDTLPEGDNLKIVCEAQSSPDSTFTFYHYMDNGTKKILNDPTAKNGVLYIEKIKPSDRGYYSCVPQNSVGEGVEAKVFVSVLFAPRITNLFFKYVNLTKHSTLKLSCNADGIPKPRITWSKFVGQTKISLNAGSVFQKSSVNENDVGIYMCQASNGNPPDASRNITVNIFYKPIINKELTPVKVPGQIGQRVELKCIAKGNPLPSFEWKKGKKERLTFSPTLTIPSLKRTDFGTYICEVSNKQGTTVHQMEVFEIEQPLVTNLQVLSIGARHADISWKLAGNKRFAIIRQNLTYGRSNQKQTAIEITGEKKHSQRLEKLTPHSNYVVKVKAWNEYIAGDEVAIRFQTDPASPGPPGAPKLEINSHVSFNVSWLPPKVTNGELTEYILEYSLINGLNDTHWTKAKTPGSVTFKILENLKNKERYKFRVRAATSAGKGRFSSTTYYVISVSDASVPRDPVVMKRSSNTYILEWKKPLRTFGKTVKILVLLEWKMKHSGRYGKENREISVKNGRGRRDKLFDWKADIKQLSPVRRLELKDLFPNTHYIVSIKEGMKFKNTIRWSGKTQSVAIETMAGVPSQPINLVVSMLTDSSLLLTWKRPLYSGGKLNKYIIFYRRSNERWSSKELIKDLKNESMITTINKLGDHKKYHVKVQASGHKPGLFSKTVEFTKDSELLKVKVESHSKESILITWSKPEKISVTKYTVYYRTANKNWLSKDVTNGLNNKTIMTTVNGLTSGTNYKIKLQASSNRYVLLSKEGNIEPMIVQARTGEDDTNYAPMFGGIIAGILIFAFVIIVVAMYIRYNYRKRQRNHRRSVASPHTTPGVLITRENGHTHMSSPSEHLSTDSPGSEKYLRPDRKGNSVQVPMKLLGGGTKPVPVVNLAEYCKQYRMDGNKGLSQEFKSIDSSATHSYEECKKAVNKAKNRYASIVTYDHTRVCLSNTGEKGSNYIHANYVDGYNSPEKFIATQGPVSTTFNDFWRMVWEQNCSAIVMVTNLIEKGKVKCQKYWPVTEAELFGSLTVNPIEEWELADYTIRKFQMQQNNNSDLIRDVTQFHYTAWPDHGVPIHPSRLLAFIKRVQNYFRVSMGKIVVHCSAGVGRSGTFIALDALLDQMRVEGVVDVYGFVSHMRSQRNSMVQTEAQYSFIYEAILEASICGETEIPVPDFSEKVQMLDRTSSASQGNLLAKEFENINLVSVDEKETCVNALMPENKKKNRFNSILPYDSNRTKLWPYPNEKGSDYINASFIDGYRNREIFIATQAPLNETSEDFWRLIWEYECYVLVMLCNLTEDQERKCTTYWPSEGEEYLVFGLLMIEMECEQEYDTFTKRTLKCTNTKSGEVRKMYHLHYTAWLEHNIPVSSSSILNFLREMLKLEQNTGNGLTVIHCSDGSGRVGILITIYVALERLKLESIVDLFSIVRILRTQRVGMVENTEQYRFCYYTIQEYLKSSKYPAIPIN